MSNYFTYFVPFNRFQEMRGFNKALFVLILVLAVFSCRKDNVPQESYDFKFRVKMSKKLQEPTIVTGYYGKVHVYEGNFMPTTDSTGRKPEPSRNHILLFGADKKAAIEAAAVQKDGTTFYSLKKLAKDGIQPKFTIIPNKSGFYQFDPNERDYCVLIAVKGNLGYYNGGVGLLPNTGGELRELEMRVDYKATF